MHGCSGRFGKAALRDLSPFIPKGIYALQKPDIFFMSPLRLNFPFRLYYFTLWSSKRQGLLGKITIALLIETFNLSCLGQCLCRYTHTRTSTCSFIFFRSDCSTLLLPLLIPLGEGSPPSFVLVSASEGLLSSVAGFRPVIAAIVSSLAYREFAFLCLPLLDSVVLFRPAAALDSSTSVHGQFRVR